MLRFGMSLSAVGSYLQERRKFVRMSRQEVADLIGTSESQVERIEAGAIDTRGSLLFKMAKVVQASLRHIADLLTDEQMREFEAAAKQLSDTELDEAIALFESLRDDPLALARWLGYGKSLKDRRG